MKLRTLIFAVTFSLMVLSGGTGSAFGAQITEESVRSVCQELGECWSRLFPAMRSSAQDVFSVTEWMADEYERRAKARLQAQDRAELESDRKLGYFHALAKSYRDECESLSELTRSGSPSDIIVLGKSRDGDGKLFDLVAMNHYHRRVAERCGRIPKGTDEHESCQKRVVLLKEPGKGRLLSFLRMLKPGSVESFTYIGHGAPDQIIVGERSLERAHNDLFQANRVGHSVKEDGALYSEDLVLGRPFANALSRAFKRDAKVSLVACETGAEFAAILGKAAEVPGVFASTTGMHFALVDRDGRVIRDPGSRGRAPLPGPGQYLELVPDAAGAFQKIDPRGAPLHRAGVLARGDYDATDDQYARNVAFQVSMGAVTATRVLNDDMSESLVVFTEEERRQVRNTMSTRKKLFDSGRRDQILSAFKNTPALREKLDRVIEQVVIHRRAAMLWGQGAPGMGTGFKAPKPEGAASVDGVLQRR